MRVFVSHSSRDKSLVREVLAKLPIQVRCWLDEEQLLFGMELKPSLRKAVQAETDLVLLFLSRDSVSSPWVRREAKWALDRERSTDDPVLLPILLDDVLDQVRPKALRERLYLKCFERTRRAVTALAEEISRQLQLWQERRGMPVGTAGGTDRLSLTGRWKSRFTWEPQDESDPGCSEDVIVVRHTDSEVLGEIQEGQFHYVFRGQVRDDHIFGEWEGTRLPLFGVFQLKIDVDSGQAASGFWVGKGAHAPYHGAWEWRRVATKAPRSRRKKSKSR